MLPDVATAGAETAETVGAFSVMVEGFELALDSLLENTFERNPRFGVGFGGAPIISTVCETTEGKVGATGFDVIGTDSVVMTGSAETFTTSGGGGI